MGYPIPDEWPEPEDDLWYCVTVDVFTGVSPPWCAEENYDSTTKCCRTGDLITDWYHWGFDCTEDREFCPLGIGSEQQITNIAGPYDTSEECGEACGE